MIQTSGVAAACRASATSLLVGMCVLAGSGAAALAQDAVASRLSFAVGQTFDLNDELQVVDSALADLDGDGDLDLLILRASRRFFPPWVHKLSIPSIVAYRNNGFALFEPFDLPPLTTELWTPIGFDTADMDSDGDADILVWGKKGDVFELRLYRNDGGQRLTSISLPERLTSSREIPQSGWIAGYSPPGFLVAGTEPDVVEVYSAAEGQSVSTPVPYRVPAVSRDKLTVVKATAWCDFDDDGDLDIAASPCTWGHSSLRLLSRGADGAFIDASQQALPAEARSFEGGDCAWADFNHDGLLDLVVANYGPPADPHPDVFLRNRGDGTFEWMSNALGADPPRRQVSACVVADFDLDGDLDVFFLGMVSTASYVAENIGDFSFAARSFVGRDGLPVASGDSVSSGDVDGDGDVDLFTNGRLQILLNNARGNVGANR